MIMMLRIIIRPAPLLSVAGEYQAAALNCQMRFVDSANDDNETNLLALSVQSGGGLVQEQDLGVAYDRSGDGNALLLATRQLRTLGADVCVVFLRQEGRRAALNVLNIRSQIPIRTFRCCFDAETSFSTKKVSR